MNYERRVPVGIDCGGLNQNDKDEIARIGFWAWFRKTRKEQAKRLAEAAKKRKKFALTPSTK